MRNKLKEIIKDFNYNYYAIRSTENKYESGQEMDEVSYLWDYEADHSSYESEELIELGGVCTTLVSDTLGDATDYRAKDMFDSVDDMIEMIIKTSKYNKRYYEYQNGHTYLVASNNRNPLNEYEADDGEAILADVIVLARL